MKLLYKRYRQLVLALALAIGHVWACWEHAFVATKAGFGPKMRMKCYRGQVRVWDVRTFKPRHAYFSHAPVDALDISQRGMLALGHGRTVQVRNAQPPHFRQAAGQKQALQLVKASGGDA